MYISADHFPTGAAHDFDAQHPTDREPNESPERVAEIGKRPGSLPSAYFSFLSLTALGEEEERHRLSSLSFIPHCIAAPPIYIKPTKYMCHALFRFLSLPYCYVSQPAAPKSGSFVKRR